MTKRTTHAKRRPHKKTGGKAPIKQATESAPPVEVTAGELPPLDAPIVPSPESDEFLDGKGMPRDKKASKDYQENKFWDIDDFFRRMPVKQDGQYEFHILVQWKDTWHQEAMIKNLKWKPLSVDRKNPKFNEKYGVMEYKCRWGTSWERFSNMSPHSQKLVEDRFGYVLDPLLCHCHCPTL